MNISIFEQWWLAIEPAVQANTLNFWQFIYKEIYLNVIKGDRWLNASHGNPTPTWVSRWPPSLRDPIFYGL